MSFLVPEGGGVLQKMVPDKYDNISLKLAKKIPATHDTSIFRFSFTNPDWTFGLPIGSHVVFSAVIPTKDKPEGELIQRKYTPITPIHNSGYVDFMIKVYKKNVHPQYLDGGIMSQYLDCQDNGTPMLMSGPYGRLNYIGFGRFTLSGKSLPTLKTSLGLCCGGTGIAPCYQVIQSALENEDDGTRLSLVFGNKTVDDILMKNDLDALAKNYPERLRVHYTVDEQPKGMWRGSVGFVDRDIVKMHLPRPSEETLIMYCGPLPFEEMMRKLLKDLGYTDDMIFKF